MSITYKEHIDLWTDLENVMNGHESLGTAVAISTNGMVRSDGRAVMGAGFAKQAVDRYGSDIQEELGEYLKSSGNHVYELFSAKCSFHVVTFPTKNDWRDKSSSELIAQSARELDSWCSVHGITLCAMPMPGVGCGGLDKLTVCRTIEPIFAASNTRFYIYEK